MAENQMIVSELGLLNINKKIADIRKYNKYLINTQGTVLVEDGVASNFGSDSYLYQTDMNFSVSELVISASGNYYPSENEGAWQIAKKYGISPEELKKANPSLETKRVIVIPKKA